MAKVVRRYYNKEQTKLEEEYFEIDGKIEGVYKEYWDNGQLKQICNYINDYRNGEYKHYHYDGQFTF